MSPPPPPCVPGGRIALFAAVAGALLTVGGVAAATVSTDEGESDWHRLVDRMSEAATGTSYAGELIIVSFTAVGPSIGMVAVRQEPDGMVVTPGPRPWSANRGDRLAPGAEADALLRIGGERTDVFSSALLLRNYEGAVVGEGDGPEDRTTVIVELTPRGDDAIRERLHVDRSSGLVLRRETFTGDGEPVRIAAFSSFEVLDDEAVEARVAPAAVDEEQSASMVASRLSPRGLEILRGTGWTAPDDLPGGFVLREAFAVGEAERSSLHLLYSDGLYGLSVYGEEGRIDGSTLAERGAVRTRLGRMRVHRWPAVEPAAYIWGGPERTYTAVSDAPPDHLANALDAFPHERERGLVSRVRRGLERAVDRLWPFG